MIHIGVHSESSCCNPNNDGINRQVAVQLEPDSFSWQHTQKLVLTYHTQELVLELPEADIAEELPEDGVELLPLEDELIENDLEVSSLGEVVGAA